VAEEIAFWHAQGCRNFHFVDSNLFHSKERMLELCDLLTVRDLRFSMVSDGMRARDADREMLRRLKGSGLDSVAIGFESANDDILKNVKKGETVDELTGCMRLLDELGIGVIGFFIIGLPGDTVLHTLRSFRFALEHANMVEAYFFNANPIEGTEFHAWVTENRQLRPARLDPLQNIGGMGGEVLVETAEFPVIERQAMYRLSKLVTLLVRYRSRTRRRLSRLWAMGHGWIESTWRALEAEDPRHGDDAKVVEEHPRYRAGQKDPLGRNCDSKGEVDP
jgi:radical SAM superfamily enzyme YgiQ (UPF0313 family)